MLYITQNYYILYILLSIIIYYTKKKKLTNINRSHNLLRIVAIKSGLYFNHNVIHIFSYYFE